MARIEFVQHLTVVLIILFNNYYISKNQCELILTIQLMFV
jgi:hypothetical protein